MSTPNGPVLRKQELDAFLLTAFSSDLTNAHYLQDLQVCFIYLFIYFVYLFIYVYLFFIFHLFGTIYLLAVNHFWCPVLR